MVAFIAVFGLALMIVAQFVSAPSWWLFGWAIALITLFAINGREKNNVYSN